MSAVVAQGILARRPSPPTTLQPADAFGNNNPFRRAPSPVGQMSPARQNLQPAAPQDKRPSRNPFIDPSNGTPVNITPPKAAHDAATAKLADDIFKTPASQAPSRTAPAPAHATPGQPQPRTLFHKPTRSGDARAGPMLSRPRGAVPSSPDKLHQRRNSESSVVDKEKAEEDRRRRERRREREARREKENRDGKDAKDPKDPKERSKTRTRKPQGLDLIDKLDLTGIYGPGMIHHDGPFDACNPHRNRKQNQKAPMQAFHPNSANNALGGGGPQQFDYDRFHGRGADAFNDFSGSRADYTTEPARPVKHLQDKVALYINPTDRGERLHGEETHGLGTSTHLEGAPASRAAVQRKENEVDAAEPSQAAGAGGISRKKSLAMRIRGMSQPRRPDFSGRVVSPDNSTPRSPESSPPTITQSAGGPARARMAGQERNPFFESNHDDAYEKKGARIEVAESRGQFRGSPSAGPALTRSITTDSAPSPPAYDRQQTNGGGFIHRMKSLKGGRRTRPEVKG